jgi:hypothetical protein
MVSVAAGRRKANRELMAFWRVSRWLEPLSNASISVIPAKAGIHFDLQR